MNNPYPTRRATRHVVTAVRAVPGPDTVRPAQARHDFCIVLIKKVKAWVWDANGAKERHAQRAVVCQAGSDHSNALETREQR